MTTFKIQFQEEVRRASFTPETATWNFFRTTVGQLFTFPAETIRSVRYIDGDGDAITVNTDLELQQLVSAYANSPSPLKLQVIVGESPSTATPMDDGSSSSSSSSSANSSAGNTQAPKDVDIEALLAGLGPFGEHAREFLNNNPQLREEAERIAEQFANGEAPSPFAAFPFLFRGSPGGFGGFGGCGWGGQQFPWAQGESCASPSPSFPFQQQSQQQQEKTPSYEKEEEELVSMGFVDVDLNTELLRKHRGDITKVILEIFWLQQQASEESY